MLEVLVLGTAAGGGFPQWNCACENCRLVRAGGLPSRWQSSVAVSGDGRDWFLVNASPDVAAQLERFVIPRLPGSDHRRFSPVRGVFVTNADLDHSLGLLALREGGALPVIASESVRASLERAFGPVLGAFGGIDWQPLPEAWTPLGGGLEVRAAPLAGGPPRYDAEAGPGTHVVGYVFRAGGRTAGVFPDVAKLDEDLIDELAACDRAWFDGTFWSDGELLALNGRTAAQMGHVPVQESLPRLAALGAGWVAYLHINNTNPVLRPDSAERAAVESAGLRVAEDGERVLL